MFHSVPPARTHAHTRTHMTHARAQDYFELGVILTRKKLFTQATKNLEKAKKVWDGEESELAQVHNALGYCYVNMDRVRGWVVWVEESGAGARGAARPSLCSAPVQRGWSLQGGRACLQSASRPCIAHPHHAQLQNDMAAVEYKRAVELQPGYVTAWNNLGDACEKNKQWRWVPAGSCFRWRSGAGRRRVKQGSWEGEGRGRAVCARLNAPGCAMRNAQETVRRKR